MAWDEQELLPKLREQFGNFAPALVLAHEWGHAIQARVGFETYQTIYMEQQADCFAGAWTAHVANGDASLHLEQRRPRHRARRSPAAARPVGHRRQPGRRARQRLRPGRRVPGRLRRWRARRARTTRTNPPTITESGYTSEADYASGGDMSLADVLPAVTDSLSSYWGKDDARRWSPTTPATRRRVTATPTVACSSTPSPTARRTTRSPTTGRR